MKQGMVRSKAGLDEGGGILKGFLTGLSSSCTYDSVLLIPLLSHPEHFFLLSLSLQLTKGILLLSYL